MSTSLVKGLMVRVAIYAEPILKDHVSTIKRGLGKGFKIKGNFLSFLYSYKTRRLYSRRTFFAKLRLTRKDDI